MQQNKKILVWKTIYKKGHHSEKEAKDGDQFFQGYFYKNKMMSVRIDKNLGKKNQTTVFETFYKNKRLRQQLFIDSKINEHTKYYKNFRKKYYCLYDLDSDRKVSILYYKNGNHKEINYYKNHKKDGKCFEFDKKGVITYEKEYYNDILINKRKVYG